MLDLGVGTPTPLRGLLGACIHAAGLGQGHMKGQGAGSAQQHAQSELHSGIGASKTWLQADTGCMAGRQADLLHTLQCWSRM